MRLRNSARTAERTSRILSDGGAGVSQKCNLSLRLVRPKPTEHLSGRAPRTGVCGREHGGDLPRDLCGGGVPADGAAGDAPAGPLHSVPGLASPRHEQQRLRRAPPDLCVRMPKHRRSWRSCADPHSTQGLHRRAADRHVAVREHRGRHRSTMPCSHGPKLPQRQQGRAPYVPVGALEQSRQRLSRRLPSSLVATGEHLRGPALDVRERGHHRAADRRRDVAKQHDDRRRIGI